MCGIAGYFSASHNFSEADLHAMTTAISHRGPDAEGFYFNESKTVGLGHRRLSILDLSTAANQPMHSHNGRYVTVFNGEVYNFQEIAKELNIAHTTTSDTEIILEAYAQKGIDCVHLFNGMFALAIYDKLNDELILLRDRLGVKPIYIFQSEHNFAFASEIKALLQSGFVKQSKEAFKPAVQNFLYAGYLPEPFTFYNKIQKLPAGSCAVVSSSGIKISSYWKPEEKVTTSVKENFTQAKSELKELLTSSVRYRMISDVPFGTFLSGGIDSSVVTAIAQNISPKPVKTFSIGFKEAKFNESEYARQVSNHLGTEHHEFTVTENDALNLVEQMMDAYDEPYADSSSIPTMLVSKLARQHVTMALSGDGGDELFLGYGTYNWAKRLNNPLVKMFRHALAFGLAQIDNRSKRAAGVFKYASEQSIKSHIFSQEQYFFSEGEIKDLLKPDFSSPILFKEKISVARNLSAQEEQALYDIKNYLKDDLLTKVDIASMQFSLEARTPFLDYRVVEFALNLSEKFKKQGNISKYILKEVLYEYVPKHIFDRPKWGFGIPLGKWLKSDLRFLIDKYLSNDVLVQCAIVEPLQVKQLLLRFEKGEDYLYNRIWVLILLHRWWLKHK